MNIRAVILPLLLLAPFVVSTPIQLALIKLSATRHAAYSSNYLAMNLYKTLASDSGNVFFSPLSLSMALSMLYYGARSMTACEMRQVLGYDRFKTPDAFVHLGFSRLLRRLTSSSEGNTLDIANSFVVQKDYPVLQQYKDFLRVIFQAEAREVDFENNGDQAVQEINNWVSRRTNNKITQLIDRLSEDTRLVLLNAVYFKGIWRTQFDEDLTYRQPFYTNGGNATTLIPMMHQTANFSHTLLEDLDTQVLELPYEGNDTTMVIFLPNEINGLAALEARLSEYAIMKAISNLTSKLVYLSLPKFNMDFERELSSDLYRLGMRRAFTDADFSGISTNDQLVVSNVFHRAVVEVNEQGTEAAASTGIGISVRTRTEDEPRPILFNANHPFLFLIMNRPRNLIMFMGRVTEL